MSCASAIADPNPARTRLRVAALDEWAEAGVALARKVVTEAWRDLGEAARLFDRIAQAVRLATVLAMRLCHPDNPAYQPTPARVRAGRSAAPEEAAENAQVENEPGEIPKRQDRIPFAAREVSDDAILRRPLKDIVKLICRVLGVAPDWSLWFDEDETPKRSETASAPARPRPKPSRKPPLLQGLFLHRALGRRLVWISPTEQAPPPPSPRTRLRSTPSPLALDPIAPSERSHPHARRWRSRPSGARTSSSAPSRATSPMAV